MGFFDIIGQIGNVATGIGTLFGVPGAGTATPAAAAQQIAPTAGQAVGRVTPLADVAKATALSAVAAGAVTVPSIISGISGAAAVFTQTIVQRIERATGSVLSEQTLRGSPFLMRSEVRALKRVSKMITKAHAKIPRKQATVSSRMLQDAVTKDLQQLTLVQALTNGHHGHHT